MRYTYLNRHGREQGPVTGNELRDLVERGRLEADAFVRCDGMTKWTPADRVPGLLSRSGSPRMAPRQGRGPGWGGLGFPVLLVAGGGAAFVLVMVLVCGGLLLFSQPGVPGVGPGQGGFGDAPPTNLVGDWDGELKLSENDIPPLIRNDPEKLAKVRAFRMPYSVRCTTDGKVLLGLPGTYVEPEHYRGWVGQTKSLTPSREEFSATCTLLAFSSNANEVSFRRRRDAKGTRLDPWHPTHPGERTPDTSQVLAITLRRANNVVQIELWSEKFTDGASEGPGTFVGLLTRK